jgi:linear primary-alkylsulfatase
MTGLRFEDRRDFEDADRGFIAELNPGIVRSRDGRVVWDSDA